MLDAGCGFGGTNLILASRFPETEFVGIDLSDLLLEMARKKARERNLEKEIRSAFSPKEARALIRDSGLRRGRFSAGLLWWRLESLPQEDV